MSYSLNSLKGGYIGDYIGATIGVINGDTRSLDYSSYTLENSCIEKLSAQEHEGHERCLALRPSSWQISLPRPAMSSAYYRGLNSYQYYGPILLV